MVQMVIGGPSVEPRAGKIRWSAPVDIPHCPSELWFDVRGAEQLSARLDAALVACLGPAMREGGTLRLDGEVTAELLDNTGRDLQAVLRHQMAFLRQVSLMACCATAAPPRAAGVLTGFSAGVDSFTVLAEYLFPQDVPEGLRVSHLLLNNVGSHGGRSTYEGRRDQRRQDVQSLGLPMIEVDSNLDDFFPGWGFQQTHTLRNAAVAHLLAPVVGTYLYASSYEFEHVRVGPTYDISYADPVVLPLLSTGALRARSVGSAYTRVQKTLKVADLDLARKQLDVCAIEHVGNCSRCWKCKRTLLTLEVLERLDDFSEVFDLEVWSSERNTYLQEVCRDRRRDPQLRDVLRLATERGYRIPMRQQLMGNLQAVAGETYRRARTLGGRVLRAAGLRR